ncbi:MAG: hypothetical protein KatS3mg019_1182 [Fimbriimonadales bacterium]|nr:MAG: hypothetical protein KatS3mg019_1182 [Fimbriimonadales bacterium]
MRWAVVLLGIGCLWAQSAAQRVGLLGCGEAVRDYAYRDALQAHGLTVVWIYPYHQFSLTSALQECDVVVLTPILNAQNMPVHAQSALEQWILGGGGLVTMEWTLWYRRWGNLFVGLNDVLPATAQPFNQQRAVRYTQQTPDPILNAGLDTQLDLGVLKETQIQARPQATVFYRSDYTPTSAGVVGWETGMGRVISFSIALGAYGSAELAHPPVSRLLANAVRWASRNACTPTEGDVNGDGCVDDADLLQVLFAFGSVGGDADVNCDQIVDDADLLEVLFRFGTGC